MKCPVCIQQHTQSKVFENGSASTLRAHSPFYDDGGKRHDHNPNRVRDGYRCSNNHYFEVSAVRKCWCGWGGSPVVTSTEHGNVSDPAVLRAMFEVSEDAQKYPASTPSNLADVLDSHELLEALAAIEHDRWSGWEKYRELCVAQVRRNGDTESHEDRWRRLRETTYADLSEASKESDRVEVRKTLAAIKSFLRGRK
jgi:hypothetical protein